MSTNFYSLWYDPARDQNYSLPVKGRTLEGSILERVIPKIIKMTKYQIASLVGAW